MKNKLLLFVTLLASSSAFAQHRAICIDNTLDPCGVHVVMFAVDPSTSPADGVHCAIASNNLYVPAYSGGSGSNYCFDNVWSFQSSIGWSAIPSGSIPTTSTEFIWTDVDFQFDCPVSVLSYTPCSNAGFELSDYYAETFSFYSCYNSVQIWSATCRNATWTTTCGGPGICWLADITVTFW